MLLRHILQVGKNANAAPGAPAHLFRFTPRPRLLSRSVCVFPRFALQLPRLVRLLVVLRLPWLHPTVAILIFVTVRLRPRRRSRRNPRTRCGTCRSRRRGGDPLLGGGDAGARGPGRHRRGARTFRRPPRRPGGNRGCLVWAAVASLAAGRGRRHARSGPATRRQSGLRGRDWLRQPPSRLWSWPEVSLDAVDRRPRTLLPPPRRRSSAAFVRPLRFRRLRTQSYRHKASTSAAADPPAPAPPLARAPPDSHKHPPGPPPLAGHPPGGTPALSRGGGGGEGG